MAPAAADTKCSSKLHYYTEDEMEKSPSRKAGMDAKTEQNLIKGCIHVMHDVAQQFRAPIWAVYGAAWLLRQYFMRRSLYLNDRFLVATACTFLALKVFESPKHLSHVAAAFEQKRWMRQATRRPDLPKKWEDARHMERFKEEVLQAERAVLYASGFALDLPYPYRFVMNEISRLQAKEGQSKSRAQLQALLQATWNLLNDSMYTPLGVRYKARDIAWSALFLGQQISQVHITLEAGQTFYSHYDIKKELLQEIVDEMTSCYVKAAEEDACSMSGSGGVPGSAAASISAPVAPGGALPPGAGTPMHMHMGISGMLASPSPMQQHQAPVQQQAQQQGPVAAPGGPPGQQGMKQEPEGGGVGHKRPPMPAQLPTDVKRQHLPAA